MPIVDLQVVGALPSEQKLGLAQRLADVIGQILGSNAQGTWIKISYLPAEHYAENGGAAPATEPVFAKVLKRALPLGDARHKEVAALTAAIAKECGRPASMVHLIYEPSAQGRVAFGGRLVE